MRYCSVLTLCSVLFFIACTPQPSESVAESTPSLEVSADFEAISSQLDLDGVKVSLISGGYEQEAMQPFVDYLDQMITLSSAAPDSPVLSGEVADKLKAFGQSLGLDEIVARGESTSRLPDGGYISKSALQVTPDANGLLWDLQGVSHNVGMLVSQFPEDTTLLLHSSVHAGNLFDRVLELVAELPDAPEDPRGELEALLEAQGVSLDALLDLLDQGTTFAVTLNEEVEWILPLPVPGGLRIPAPGVVVSLQDPSGTLGDLLVSRVREVSPLPILEQDIEGKIIPYLPIPLPVATPVAIHIANVGDRVIITSSTELMREMLQRENAPSPIPLMTKLAPLGSDLTASGFWISDGRLFEVQRNATLQILEGQAMKDENTAFMLDTLREMSSGGHPLFALPEIMLLDREHEFIRVRMLHQKALPSSSSTTSMMAVPAVGGLLAAIALPSFQQARASAQQNACINHLRMLAGATDQWAIENNHSTGTPVTFENLNPYLGGMSLECPAGGTYTITVVGENPVCSQPGHQLP